MNKTDLPSGRRLPAMSDVDHGPTDARDYTIAFVVWGIGAWGLYALIDWANTLEPAWRGPIEFAAYGLCGVYILALIPLKYYVTRFFNRHPDKPA